MTDLCQPVSLQGSDGQSEHGPPSSLKRRSSVQEILSSPRNKLMRQSSLQQQKVPKRFE